MMAGNPNWWSLSSTPSFFHHQELPQSWCHLLMGGLQGDDQENFHKKKLENWEEDHHQEEQILSSSQSNNHLVDVQQEISQNSYLYGHGDEEFHQAPIRPIWSQIMPNSSPKSCITSLSGNMLDFSSSKTEQRHQQLEYSSDRCHSTTNGGVCKKARVQSSSNQPSLKVRKEKLGDRITSLHQLVSPFGKTDTASVLLEAIGYIRFLQDQIEALSSPYLGTAPPGTTRKHQSYHDTHQDKAMDLRSRGLCLVPVSCTQQVGSDNGADYWAPAYGGGF